LAEAKICDVSPSPALIKVSCEKGEFEVSVVNTEVKFDLGSFIRTD